MWAIGAPLTHSTGAVFGSPDPAGVDRHRTPFTGYHKRAVGWTIVGKRAAAGRVGGLFIKSIQMPV